MNFPEPISLGLLAQLTGSEAIGNLDGLVIGMNEIHRTRPGDLTFVDHPKYYQKALASPATFILINQKVECPEGKALLIHSDPFAAWVSLARRFRPFMSSAQIISPTASIGQGTIIQPGAFIGNHVTIGKNCIIHANVSIYDHSVIGNDVIIHSNTVIGADAYYFQRRSEGYRKLESCGRVVIGDKVEIGALCAIDRGVSSDTIIGDGTKFDNHVQVGHDTYIGRNCLIGAHCAIAGVTIIEDDVILWGRVSVNKDLVIGQGAVLLAHTGVSKSLEGGKTYFGVPATEARIKWREIAALRRLPDIIANLERQP